MRNKKQILKTPSPHPSLLPGLNFTPPPEQHRGTGNGVVVSSSHAVSAAPSSSGKDFSHIHLLWCGVLYGLQVEICSTIDLHGLQGDSLPPDGLHHGLQVKALFSGTWSSCSPCIFTDLGVCRVVALTSSHSSLLLQGFFSPI